MMNGHGKSDGSVVPAKSLNNAEGPATEAREGRELAKGNSPECNALRTQSRDSTPNALERVRQAATRDKKQRFTALLHHVYDVERLRAAYLTMKKDAAPGVDGETWVALRRESRGQSPGSLPSTQARSVASETGS